MTDNRDTTPETGEDDIQAEFAHLRATEAEHPDEPAEPVSDELEIVQEAQVVESLLEDEVDGRA